MNPYAYAGNDPINNVNGKRNIRVRRQRGTNVRSSFYAMRINSLERQIRRIDPTYKYQVVRPIGSKYTQRDVDTVIQHLQNARSAGFCGSGAAHLPNFIRNGRVSLSNLTNNIIPEDEPNRFANFGNNLTGEKYRWRNRFGIKFEVHWHGPNSNAPITSESYLHPTLSIQINNRFLRKDGSTVRNRKTESDFEQTHFRIE